MTAKWTAHNCLFSARAFQYCSCPPNPPYFIRAQSGKTFHAHHPDVDFASQMLKQLSVREKGESGVWGLLAELLRSGCIADGPEVSEMKAEARRCVFASINRSREVCVFASINSSRGVCVFASINRSIRRRLSRFVFGF